MLSRADGLVAVRLARRAVESVLLPATVPAEPLPALFRERRGVFVTWKDRSTGALRGCVGFPLPSLPLADGIPQASIAAALEDPRFPPVGREELGRLVVEVSVLTVPRPLGGGEPSREVRAGIDGVIVDSGGRSGLLLPQVAIEQGWTSEELLDGACEKAGIAPGRWRRREVRIRTFQAEIFGESEPNGPVEPRETGRPARD